MHRTAPHRAPCCAVYEQMSIRRRRLTPPVPVEIFVIKQQRQQQHADIARRPIKRSAIAEKNT